MAKNGRLTIQQQKRGQEPEPIRTIPKGRKAYSEESQADFGEDFNV